MSLQSKRVKRKKFKTVEQRCSRSLSLLNRKTDETLSQNSFNFSSNFKRKNTRDDHIALTGINLEGI